MSPCETAEFIIVSAMEMTRLRYEERIASVKNPESRLDFIDRYATTLNALSEALRRISTECLSRCC